MIFVCVGLITGNGLVARRDESDKVGLSPTQDSVADVRKIPTVSIPPISPTEKRMCSGVWSGVRGVLVIVY